MSQSPLQDPLPTSNYTKDHDSASLEQSGLMADKDAGLGVVNPTRYGGLYIYGKKWARYRCRNCGGRYKSDETLGRYLREQQIVIGLLKTPCSL
jgi:hypothetical protein